MKTIPSFFILCVLAGCSSGPQSTVHGPQSSELRLDPPLGGSAPKLIFAAGNEQAAVILPVVYHRAVGWGYPEPMPADNIAFDVESSTNLTDWQLLFTTNQCPAYFTSLNPSESIRVGAHWIDLNSQPSTNNSPP